MTSSSSAGSIWSSFPIWFLLYPVALGGPFCADYLVRYQKSGTWPELVAVLGSGQLLPSLAVLALGSAVSMYQSGVDRPPWIRYASIMLGGAGVTSTLLFAVTTAELVDALPYQKAGLRLRTVTQSLWLAAFVLSVSAYGNWLAAHRRVGNA